MQMSDKILIFGKGYFGSKIQHELGGEFAEEKVFTLDDATRQIDRHKPQVVINAIGYIGRNVDDCELNKDKALSANTLVPILLGEACFRAQVRFVHISTGCIYHYDYTKNIPITEDQVPDFYDLYYSRTKIYAEQALLFLARKMPILILRPRVPLDTVVNPKNLLTKLIRSKKVIDLPNSSTYIPDFIRALKHLLEKKARGIYHIVNKGPLYYPDLVKEYRKHVPDFKYEVIDFKKLNIVRTNIVLSTSKLESSGFRVRTISEVLEECVKKYIKS